MAYVWLGRTTHEEAGMGDWYQRQDGKWIYDKNAPSPGQNPAVTQMLNAVTPPPVDEPEVERIRPRNDLDAAGEEIR